MTKIAILGRPNVGKSSYFNRLLSKRCAIVDDEAGTTRDYISNMLEIDDTSIELIDTAGLNLHKNDPFSLQATLALEIADAIVMIVDGKTGPQLEDKNIAKLLLKSKKPLVLAINKIDHEEQEIPHSFSQLGIKKMFGISALHNRNCFEPIESLVAVLPPEAPEPKNMGPKVAILGLCNVGKSTLTNAFINQERLATSTIPGTTRDSISITLIHNDKPYTFIDTAGIKRRNLKVELVEKLAFLRTKQALKEADLVLLLLDATKGMSAKEKKIMNMIEEEGKSVCILLNKWDLVKNIRQEHVTKALKMQIPYLKHCPFLCISAKTKLNLEKIFPHIEHLLNERNKRIPTGKLNQFLEKVMQQRPPAMLKGKRLRIYYTTQAGTSPPTFLLFVNYKNLMQKTYIQYLKNQFRKAFQFSGAPINVYLKSHAKH
ncbi:MAG: GTPase Der [Chlamydiae bacterium]|nr:GTPase Der [Chlamydiota bacterium]